MEPAIFLLENGAQLVSGGSHSDRDRLAFCFDIRESASARPDDSLWELDCQGDKAVYAPLVISAFNPPEIP